MRIFRKLAQMLDVNVAAVTDGDALVYDQATGKWVPGAGGGGGGGGAPTDVDYLVGTASGDLSAEIVVGTAPGGELGGTWASPTVDATHSGSSHASVQAAAEATAAGALSAHASDTTGIHGIADTSALETSAGAQSKVDTHSADTTAVHGITDTADLIVEGDSRLTDSRAPSGTAGGVLGGTYPNPSFAADMATQAELDAHVNDTSDAHDASAISVADSGGNFTGSDVEAVLAELASGGGGGGTGTGLTGYESRSSNTILGTADTGKTIDITAAITQTFTAAATLTAGWWVILRNATTNGTTVVTLDPNSTETIDGLATPKMYSGEARLIVCDGTGFHSYLVSPGFALFTADGTFQVPYGISQLTVECVGGGGGGGGSAAATPGSGGGGGAHNRVSLKAAAAGSPGDSISVDVAAGGAGGAATVDGTAGGPTTFGSFVSAYGGGGGSAANDVKSGGGGGGIGEVGGLGSTGASAGVGGGNISQTNPGWGGAGGGGYQASNAIGRPAESGGGGGGACISSSVSGNGGTSLRGGGGGGAGKPSGGGAGAGGASGSYSTSGGGGGAANGGTGADGTGAAAGAGGGGGAANGNGGAGGAPGGGGGGGGATTGQVGAGARGECRVWYS